MIYNRGQIWIETVIYTLIGLTIIGIVLSLVTPRVNEYRDRAVIEQTIDSLEIFDNTIQEVVDEGAGNVRIVEFTMKRGKLVIDPGSSEVLYILEGSRVLYSEDGIPVQVGQVEVLTEEGLKTHTVTLKLTYPHNLTIDLSDSLREFSSTSLPYRFSLRNQGIVNGSVQLDIREIS